MSDTLRNKYCVIGASQSGKTHFVINNLLPVIDYDRFILCGHDHNISKYADHLDPDVKLQYFGHDPDVVVARLEKLMSLLSNLPASRKKETLIVFDDFIDNHAIKNRAFMDFIATCRHQQITIIYVCHSVDTVLTPFMKTNMTHFIICQYAPSQNFKMFMNTFLAPIVSTDMAIQNGQVPSDQELNTAMRQILNTAFSGRYGCLIISVNTRDFRVIAPIDKQ